MITFQDRLLYAFNRLPATKQYKNKLATHCGVGPSTVNDWFSGKTKLPGAKHLKPLAEYLGVQESWLLDGKGSMEREGSNVVPVPMGNFRVPLLNYVQAGKFTEVGEGMDISEFEYLFSNTDFKGDAFGLEIRGESMAPMFQEGDQVIIDCGIRPQPGDFVVAKNGSEEANFKQYRLISTGEVDVFELIPLNPNYPTVRSDKQHLEIIGVMVEHRRFRSRK